MPTQPSNCVLEPGESCCIYPSLTSTRLGLLRHPQVEAGNGVPAVPKPSGARGAPHAAPKVGKNNFHIPRQALRNILLDALPEGTVTWNCPIARLEQLPGGDAANAAAESERSPPPDSTSQGVLIHFANGQEPYRATAGEMLCSSHDVVVLELRARRYRAKLASVGRCVESVSNSTSACQTFGCQWRRLASATDIAFRMLLYCIFSCCG